MAGFVGCVSQILPSLRLIIYFTTLMMTLTWFEALEKIMICAVNCDEARDVVGVDAR